MQKLVIIGSGMAGGKLAEELVRSGDLSYKITIIGEEPYGNYDRIQLASLIKDEEPDNFWINNESWYKKNGISSILGEKVIEIDRKKKIVKTDKNKIVAYDILAIATGSRPLIPSIDGIERQGVMVLRNIEDVNNVKKWIKDKEKVLVIGGGLLGLELAVIHNELGKEVTVSHLMNNLVETQLNKEAAKYLENILKEHNINFVMGTYVTNLTENNDASIFRRKVINQTI